MRKEKKTLIPHDLTLILALNLGTVLGTVSTFGSFYNVLHVRCLNFFANIF